MLAASAASAFPPREDIGEMLHGAGAAGSDHGNADGLADCGGQLAVEAGAGSVGVHGGEQNFAGPARFRFARPLDDAAARWLASALNKDLRIADGIGGLGIAAGVDGHDYCLRAKVAADRVDERRVGEGGGVDAYLVGARIEDVLGVARAADAPAHGEGHKELAGGAADGIEQGLTAFVRGGDVEQHDFVGAFARVTRGLRSRIAGVDEIDELNALDHAAAVNIETGDDALGQHHNSRKLLRILRPVAPDFSG